MAGANGVQYCCFMLFKKGWGSTDFKRCFIIKSCLSDTSFLVGLTASHVISPSGHRFVARIAGVASEACVSLSHIIAMGPTVGGCSLGGTSWALPVTPFLIEQGFQFSQLRSAFFKLFDKTRIGLG
jgi:hypothetical protein